MDSPWATMPSFGVYEFHTDKNEFSTWVFDDFQTPILINIKYTTCIHIVESSLVTYSDLNSARLRDAMITKDRTSNE